MRTMALLSTAALLGVVLLAFVPAAEARTLYCTDLRSSTCPGLVCVDANLDNKFQWEECVIVYCVDGCCGAPCPPPVEPSGIPPVCVERSVGGTPVEVTLEYGTGVGCFGATYTTCRLSYYPGEPNTPVWVCTTKRVL